MDLPEVGAGSPFVEGVAIGGAVIGVGVFMIGAWVLRQWANQFGGWKAALKDGDSSLKSLVAMGDRLARVEADVHAIRDLLNDVPKAITNSNQAIEVAVQHGEEMNEVRQRLMAMESDLRTIRDELIAAALQHK